MFYHINGVVTDIEPNLAVLGVRRRWLCAQREPEHAQQASETGERVKLYIYECIREDAHDLYGFGSKSEKHCFELLLGISGVGPKAALSILSSNTPDGLALAVLNGDEKALTTAPGIGKRIAQRILLELKDKMAKESASVDFADLMPAVPASDSASAARSDAIAGLTVLGYSMPEINAALRTLPSIEGMSADQIIKAALRAHDAAVSRGGSIYEHQFFRGRPAGGRYFFPRTSGGFR
ncbi:MAG: Holliday junction branch migration protein RuvA [Oscillospiraceae bacterium]